MLKLHNFLLTAFLLFNLSPIKAMEEFNELDTRDTSKPSLILTQTEALEGIDKIGSLLNSESTSTRITYPIGQQPSGLPFGYISTDTDCKNIYVTFRGTLGVDELTPSLIRETVELNSFQPFQNFPGHIHAAYFNIFQSFTPEIDSNLKSIFDKKADAPSQLENIWCIGYSVGGGYAHLSAAYLGAKLNELLPTASPSLKVLTYAAPYLFDSAGKSCFSRMHSISLNVNFVAKEDLIARYLSGYQFESGSDREVSFPASLATTYRQRVEHKTFTGMMPEMANYLRNPLVSIFAKLLGDKTGLPSHFLEPTCWEAHALSTYQEAVSAQWQSLEKNLNAPSL